MFYKKHANFNSTIKDKNNEVTSRGDNESGLRERISKTIAEDEEGAEKS